jgi:hypothetical protein
MTRFTSCVVGISSFIGACLLFPRALEINCYAVLLIWLTTRKPLRTLFGQLNYGHRILLVSFVIALVAAQVIQQESKTFPMVPWAMFTKPVSGNPDYFEYTATRSDGGEVNLLLREELFPEPLGQNLMIHLAKLARLSADPDSCSPEDVLRFEKMVKVLAKSYNQLHSDSPVLVVHVWRCTIPIGDYHGSSSIRREPFRTIPLP